MKRIAAILLAALMPFGAAQAAVVNGSFDFSFNAGGTINPFEGSFDINFDTATVVPGSETTTGLSNVVLPFTLSSGETSAFVYLPGSGTFTDVLVVGGTRTGVLTIICGVACANDFYVGIMNVSTSPVLVAGAYSVGTGLVTIYTGGIGTVIFTPAGAPIPAPASLALLGIGLAGLAASRRRRP